MKTLVGAAEPEDSPPLNPQVTLTTTTTTTWGQWTMSFVCEKCRAGDHDACPGQTRCDCQHKVQK